RWRCEDRKICNAVVMARTQFLRAAEMKEPAEACRTSPRGTTRAAYAGIVPLLLVPVIVVALIALVPFSLVQRYRMGTSRQRARGWLASINRVGLSLSAIVFLVSAAVTSVWVPRALSYTLAGFASGCALGIVG